MGQLLSTGVSIEGHTAAFTYCGVDQDRTCVMTCACGWSSPITSFGHPHSIIEVRRRFDRHLAESGVDPTRSYEDRGASNETGKGPQ
jgi:hypothetical protein